MNSLLNEMHEIIDVVIDEAHQMCWKERLVILAFILAFGAACFMGGAYSSPFVFPKP